MSGDAKELHKFLVERKTLLDERDELLAKEKNDRLTSQLQARRKKSAARIDKEHSKENERKKVSRTLMANLVTAADYPDAPTYIPHMINVCQNILGSLIF